MLKRQRIILALLAGVGAQLNRTRFVKLIFLLRQETPRDHLPSFYDFVPYKYGPFSFALYRDVEILREAGYLQADPRLALTSLGGQIARKEVDKLPTKVASAVTNLVSSYGKTNQIDLVETVYRRYPWFALNSELPKQSPAPQSRPAPESGPAVYTIGYEGKSIDYFLNELLERGIKTLIDVRANPISRKYGFSKSRLRHLCGRLDVGYQHLPSLGISSQDRADLGSFNSYQRLLRQYEKSVLASRANEVAELGQIMSQTPSALMCVEEVVECCHRSRLAEAVADVSSLEIIHL